MESSKGFSLNPDAPPFIPLSRRGPNYHMCVTTSKDSDKKETNDTICDSKPKENDEKGTNDTNFVSTSQESNEGTNGNNSSSKEKCYSFVRACLEFLDDEAKKEEKERNEKGYTMKDPYAIASYYSASQSLNGAEEEELQFEMDLAYLKMTFPGISYESLVDAYSMNLGDLEDTIDMLRELETDPGDEFYSSLPITHCAPSELNNVADASELQASNNPSDYPFTA